MPRPRTRPRIRRESAPHAWARSTMRAGGGPGRRRSTPARASGWRGRCRTSRAATRSRRCSSGASRKPRRRCAARWSATPTTRRRKRCTPMCSSSAGRWTRRAWRSTTGSRWTPSTPTCTRRTWRWRRDSRTRRWRNASARRSLSRQGTHIMSELAIDGALGSASDVELIDELARARGRIAHEIAKRVVGQEAVIEQLLIALFSRGHCLFVGVPGLAKTLLISTLAEALSLTFNRIQFTPDLMPSDITGTDVLEEDHTTGRRAFRFVPGPVFAHVLLADEINRTPPKTQAALLQAMQEPRVTAGGHTYPLGGQSLGSPSQNPTSRRGPNPRPRGRQNGSCFWGAAGNPGAKDEGRIVRG